MIKSIRYGVKVRKYEENLTEGENVSVKTVETDGLGKDEGKY